MPDHDPDYWSVRCPECDAAPGFNCRSTSSRRLFVGFTHRKRRALAWQEWQEAEDGV